MTTSEHRVEEMHKPKKKSQDGGAYSILSLE